MDLHRRHSERSDESSSSDHSKDRPPLFSCDGNQPEDVCQWKLEDELKRSIEELQSEFDRNHQTLNDQIKELNDIADELESMHWNTKVGSLVGSSIGAAGGIASIAGVCLAPFTLGASLALTGAGTVAGVSGGVTGAASHITNMIKLKNLRETIKKIIKDFLNTINPMIELMGKIYDITEDIESVQTLNKHEIQRAARGAEDILKIVEVDGLAQMGKLCAEAAKEIRVYVKAVNAARGPAGAAKAIRATAGAVKEIRMYVKAVNAARGPAGAAKAIRATAGAVKEIRMAAAFTGALSALFLALDVYSIVQDSAELSEMNKPADKRKAEETTSETLKCILQMRKTADQFKKSVDKITDAIDTYSSFPTNHSYTVGGAVTLLLKESYEEEAETSNRAAFTPCRNYRSVETTTRDFLFGAPDRELCVSMATLSP